MGLGRIVLTERSQSEESTYRFSFCTESEREKPQAQVPPALAGRMGALPPGIRRVRQDIPGRCVHSTVKPLNAAQLYI